MTDNPRLRINTFRSTDVERYLWEAWAARAGVTLSDFLRTAANEAAIIEPILHPTVDMEIHGETVSIDVKVAEIVRLLNCWPGIRTISSCQGILSDPRWSKWTAHIALASDNPDWRALAEFGFETLKPLADMEVTVQVSADRQLWLYFPYEMIDAVEKVLKALAANEKAERVRQIGEDDK